MVLKEGTGKFTGDSTVGGFPNKAPDLGDSDLSNENQALLDDTEIDGMNYQLSGNYGVAFENGGYFNMNGLYPQAVRTIRPNISDATKKDALLKGIPYTLENKNFTSIPP